jgi:uncharacterized protein (DUF1330 family)
MIISAENAIAAIGLLGVGTVVGNYFQFRWQRRSSELSKKQEFKETRYKCIIMLMYASLDFDKRGRNLKQFGRSFLVEGEIFEELQTEWHNMILFASDNALKTVYLFIHSPTQKNFKAAALAMRKDLWGGKLSTDLERLDFE